LAPGQEGFDVVDLLDLAAYRGWQASVERAGAVAGSRRWRATVLTVRPQSDAFQTVLSGTVSHGATEGEALAVALASMLRRGDVG
jgi:hypothetical protein